MFTWRNDDGARVITNTQAGRELNGGETTKRGLSDAGSELAAVRDSRLDAHLRHHTQRNEQLAAESQLAISRGIATGN